MSSPSATHNPKSQHLWQRYDIELEASESYANPYTEVDVWVDLEGPGFKRRVYGFWDGERRFTVRIAATAPGVWRWTSGSNRKDAGLNGKRGELTAADWTDQEKRANPLRRGFLRASANGRSFVHPDGTPFFLLGDTWWATPTFRYPWFEEADRKIGPDMGFKEMVAYRKAQGYNAIAILAGFPNWAMDGAPAQIRMEDERHTAIRSAWKEPGTDTAKDMHNEGGRPFEFPGKVPGYEKIVPDYDRINPAYFQYMDRKIDYLNDEGFVAFIEVSRRDASESWRNYGGWPDSYERYIHYVFTRYQANNTLLSPIHFDSSAFSIPSREYNEPANLELKKYGPPPFGTLVGTNAAPSTLINFGGPEEAPWLTFHQLGNWREHEHYWYLTEIHGSSPALPAVNGEPYYPGFPNDDPPADTIDAELNCRSGMYGGLLSGAFAGYIYGVEGVWGGDISPKARYRMWEAIQFRSGALVKYLKAFLVAAGERAGELDPDQELVVPNKSGPSLGYRGWAFCARTAEKELLLLYFEKGCLRPLLRGLVPLRRYNGKWFDPRNGKWIGGGEIEALDTDQTGRVSLPPLPDDQDWGLALRLADK
ncbi:MAG TPA: DUF5060 domain-containing protein [Spirochaetia bacterium]|nr:DUF5060 domain-containing protein [Spirochaetia bacterium]